jgi:O-antigen/teichoic acid export membrane protein
MPARGICGSRRGEEPLESCHEGELETVVRRALAIAAGEQYFRLAINILSIAAISRLLTPTEIGVSVIGMGIMAIALGLREFATSDFLIRRREVTHDDMRTSSSRSAITCQGSNG